MCSGCDREKAAAQVSAFNIHVIKYGHLAAKHVHMTLILPAALASSEEIKASARREGLISSDSSDIFSGDPWVQQSPPYDTPAPKARVASSSC